jgi:hypothetical protein
MQQTLSSEQIAEFHHDVFVRDQLAHFAQLVRTPPAGVVVDIGGGMGHFARALAQREARTTRVLDLDPISVGLSREAGVHAEVADALAPPIAGDEEGACFNLVLHHLVAASASETRQLQMRALRVWRTQAQWLFVNEYIYDSYAADFSGAFIHAVTRSRVLSAIARAAARIAPSLRANTLGVGVRFRSRAAWLALFEEAGLEVVAQAEGRCERVPWPLRLLLIAQIRRDSFLLRVR